MMDLFLGCYETVTARLVATAAARLAEGDSFGFKLLRVAGGAVLLDIGRFEPGKFRGSFYLEARD